MKRAKRVRQVLLSIALLLLFGGCAAPQREPSAPQVEALPYRFELTFSSQLPARVVPGQAPIDAHDRYPLNDRLERRLRQLLDARSTARAEQTVTVSVNVIDLEFDYEEIGAGRTAPGLPQLAARTTALSSLEMDGGGLEIPYETIKTAVLAFEVTLEQDARILVERRLSAEYVETVRRDDFYATWPHDYHSFDKVVSGLNETVTAEVDDLLVEFFGGT